MKTLYIAAFILCGYLLQGTLDFYWLRKAEPLPKTVVYAEPVLSPPLGCGQWISKSGPGELPRTYYVCADATARKP